jgi:hypothetical protein
MCVLFPLLCDPPCSFFIVQLSSMITGWCAISALKGPLPKGTSVFSAVLLKVASAGAGQAFLSSLLLASGAPGLLWCSRCCGCSVCNGCRGCSLFCLKGLGSLGQCLQAQQSSPTQLRKR